MNNSRLIIVTMGVAMSLFACENQLGCKTHHPQLKVRLVQSGEKRIIELSTSLAIEGNNLAVQNEACTLSVVFTRSKKQDSLSMPVVVQNTTNDGGFHGGWTIPDTLLVYDTASIYGCISDVEGEESCVEEVVSIEGL